MQIDPARMQEDFRAMRRRRGARDEHVARRCAPAVYHYDYLLMEALNRNMVELLSLVRPVAGRGVALDVGSSASPYRQRLHAAGFETRTLDIDAAAGPDFVGSAEDTGLPEASFDLVVCTQVLEHLSRPLVALREIRRVLKPGGHLILAVPHVWPYHPCPGDFWRFTQEGVAEMCRSAEFEIVTLLGAGGCSVTLFQTMNLFVYGLAGRLGAPLYLAVNVVGKALDKVVRNQLFCMNFTCLARKPQPIQAQAGSGEPR
jgi:SAM-dependent methyltransferase